MTNSAAGQMGELLRRYRRQAAITQEELAHRSGVSVRAISDLERGLRGAPQRHTLQVLGRALQLADTQRAMLESMAHRRARRHAPPLDDPRAGTLSPPSTPLLGREVEADTLQRLLNTPTVRLITITGPGGVGKTHLAQHAMQAQRERYGSDVRAAFLDQLRSPQDVAAAIGAALGLREGLMQGMAALRQCLRGRQVLLLLDTFEHLAEAAPLLVEVLENYTGLRLLVTSRAACHLRAEHLVRLAPLALPDPADLERLAGPEALGRWAAVALFVARAAAHAPGFTLHAGNAGAVVALCARLDGLPLAIEQAAHAALLSPQAVLDRLQQRGDLPGAHACDLPTRHRSMRSSLQWSYDLLDAPQRVLFARLAIFVGGCTLAAAEHICAEVNGTCIPVWQGLAALVECHMLQVEDSAEQGAEGPRLLLLQTAHDVARELLAAGGEWEALAERHAGYYGGPRRGASDPPAWHGSLSPREQGNIAAARAWIAARPCVGYRRDPGVSEAASRPQPACSHATALSGILDLQGCAARRRGPQWGGLRP